MSENPLPKFAVNIAPPLHGWIDIKVQYGDAQFYDMLSHIWPDSVLQLIEIIIGLAQGRQDEMMVEFYAEPILYEWFFTSDRDEIKLRIDEYSDASFHVASQCKTIFEAYSNREEMCLTFWRAFRKLQSEITPEAYLKHWHYAFPSKQIDTLTNFIKGRQL